MQFVLDRIPSRERLRLGCALAFWAATYFLFVAWNLLQSQFPVELWQARRLLTTLVGAVLFFGLTRLADGLTARPVRERSVILLATAGLCCAAMVAAREVIDHSVVAAIGEPLSTIERHLRFTLVWSGYFAGGVLAFLSLAPLPAARAEPARDEPSAPERANDYPDALWVSRGRETVRVAIDAIEWIEAEGDYVRLHAGAGGGLMRGTLSGLESRLDPAVFARVHRSAICRRQSIVAMLRKPSGAMAVRLASGAEVPVGRSYRDSIAVLLGPARDGPSRLSA